MAKPARRKRTITTVEADLAADASLGDVVPGTRRGTGYGERPGRGLPRAHRGVRPGRAAAQFGARGQSGRACHRRPASTAWNRARPAARRHPDPGQGQHRHRRQPAHDGGVAGAGRGAGRARRDPGRAAARRRRGHSRQGQPDRVRQHPRDRHAVRLQLVRRPGAATPMRRRSTTRHAAGAARRVEFGLGGGGRRRAVRRRDRHRDLGLALARRRRTASSRSSRRSG